MNDALQHHLDGELPVERLGEEERLEAEAWEQLLVAFRTEVPGATAPPWLEAQVMAEIDALPEPGLLRRALSWLVAPRPMRISPLTVGLATAALAAIFIVDRQGLDPIPSGGVEVGAGASSLASTVEEGGTMVYVQFILDAPGAASVAVTGDFDRWEGSYSLQDADGDGVWSGRVPIQPGVHTYMFLVDGSTWMTDPRAERFQEDGFGNQNAILAVATPNA